MEKIEFVWNALTTEQWQAALCQANDCALQQDSSYALAIREQGHEVQQAGLLVDNQLRCIAQIAERHIFGPVKIALLMRGPVWLGPVDLRLEQLFLAEIRYRLEGAVLLWTPERLADEANAHSMHGYRRVLTGYSTIMLDLRPQLAAIEGTLRGKWRNLLRAGRRNALRIASVKGGRELNWIVERNEAHRKVIGYAGPTPDFIRSLGQFALPKGRLAWIAESQNEPVAGIIAHVHGRTATYYVGCTTPRGRDLRAHHCLLWHAVEQLKGRGVDQFDLGGIDTDKARGVARFKLGMGGTPITLAGTYLVPPRFGAAKRKGPQLPAALPELVSQSDRAA